MINNDYINFIQLLFLEDLNDENILEIYKNILLYFYDKKTYVKLIDNIYVFKIEFNNDLYEFYINKEKFSFKLDEYNNIYKITNNINKDDYKLFEIKKQEKQANEQIKNDKQNNEKKESNEKKENKYNKFNKNNKSNNNNKPKKEKKENLNTNKKIKENDYAEEMQEDLLNTEFNFLNEDEDDEEENYNQDKKNADEQIKLIIHTHKEQDIKTKNETNINKDKKIENIEEEKDTINFDKKKNNSNKINTIENINIIENEIEYFVERKDLIFDRYVYFYKKLEDKNFIKDKIEVLVIPLIGNNTHETCPILVYVINKKFNIIKASRNNYKTNVNCNIPNASFDVKATLTTDNDFKSVFYPLDLKYIDGKIIKEKRENPPIDYSTTTITYEKKYIIYVFPIEKENNSLGVCETIICIFYKNDYYTDTTKNGIYNFQNKIKIKTYWENNLLKADISNI